MFRRASAFGFTLGLLMFAGPALADPCTRIPDRGTMPPELASGRTFGGTVVHVGDGDSLCVETIRGIGGAGWVEVRVADFHAPELNRPGGREARSSLVNIVMNRRVNCRARNRSYDRVVAVCTIGGVNLADRMRRAGIAEGGR